MIILYVLELWTLSIRSKVDVRVSSSLVTPIFSEISSFLTLCMEENISTDKLTEIKCDLRDKDLFKNFEICQYLETVSVAIMRDFTNGAGKTFLQRLFLCLQSNCTKVSPNSYKSVEYDWRIFYNTAPLSQSNTSGDRQPDFACQVLHNNKLIE